MDCISFDHETGLFTLRTANTMYQMMIGEYGYLLHLYYGPDLGDMDTSYRLVYLDRGFCPNPPEAERDRTFSLDVLPQEYSGYGNGDYRTCSLDIAHQDGSCVADLRYESHQIEPGKYSIDGMPALYGDEEQAQTLTIRLSDSVNGIRVWLRYGVFPAHDVITRAVRIENAGDRSFRIRKVMSMQLDVLEGEWELMHFHGRHAMERITERTPLGHGSFSIASTRGTSSHQHSPFAILLQPGTTEDTGRCYGFSFVYSGNFLLEAMVDQFGSTRLEMGIHPYQFWYELPCEEFFDGPEVIMSFSDCGLAKLSHHFHDAIRSNLIRSRYVAQPRPILVNNWEATYFGFNEKKLYDIAVKAKEMGLDLFVLDDGWFGRRDSDDTALGDWIVNEEKIRGGLQLLAERIRGLGLQFGLWIEPEMISEDSDLYRAHPDWCMRNPGREPNRGRSQLNLDITRPEVRRHVLDQIMEIIDTCGVTYVKWDMNRSLGNVYSAALPPQKQGKVYHRYVMALYEMQEELIQRFPDLLLENCSGGGGRFDAGMLYYSPQIWCSDNTDALDRLTIQYGTSFGFPVSTMGAHVSVCPNHQTGRSVPFDVRAIVAGGGTFGFELDLEEMSKEEMEQARYYLERYRRKEHLMQTGDYYRLSDPTKNCGHVLWQYVSKDRRETRVEGVQLRSQANTPVSYVHLKGLIPEAKYRELKTNGLYTGAALMVAGLPLPTESDDCCPVKYHFKAE